MKKNYEKPMIFFESFSLNVSIAGDCKIITDNPTEGSCGIPGSAPGLDVFSQGDTGCIIWDKDGVDDNNGFCYHVPTEGNNLFNS